MELMFNVLEILRNSFAHHIIFSLGLLFIFGYFLELIAEQLKLPSITGYIIAGIIVGSSGLDLIHHSNTGQLHLISEITLSFIAVIIGTEFSLKKLKKYGKEIVILTLFQLFCAFVLISLAMFFFGLPLYIAILFGAIGAATAPAAVVVLVEQMRVRGKFVNYLYGIVALDDAGTVILFSVTFAISSSIIGNTGLSVTHSILHGLTEILYSIIIGFFAGIFIHFTTYKKRGWDQIKIISLGLIFLATSLSISLHLSPLITNMTLGMVLINMNSKNIRIMKIIEPLTPPLYALFFAIAGVELNIALFGEIPILIAALVFITARVAGKYSGIYLPARIYKMNDNIKKYLGLALLPQAGVAIGLAIFIRTSPIVAEAAEPIRLQITEMINIILISVIFNELFGPPIAKYAIEKGCNRR